MTLRLRWDHLLRVLHFIASCVDSRFYALRLSCLITTFLDNFSEILRPAVQTSRRRQSMKRIRYTVAILALNFQKGRKLLGISEDTPGEKPSLYASIPDIL